MPLPLTPAYGRTTSSASCLLWESCGSLLLWGRNTRYDQELSREGRKTDRSGTCLPHRLRSRPHNRMPRGPLSRVARRHARQLLLYDLCELAHLFFHLDHLDRKSTRLNSSHVAISYAVFCLKKKNNMSNLFVYCQKLSSFDILCNF